MSAEARAALFALFPDCKIVSVRLHSRSLFALYDVRLSGPGPDRLALKMVANMAMANAEARGLEALKAAGVSAPGVYSVCHKPAAIAMEFVNSGGRFDPALLVQDLTRLYQTPGPHFGWNEHNFIGTLAQPNHKHDRFHEFWWKDRLAPQYNQARRAGLLSTEMEKDLRLSLERFCARFEPDRVGPRLVHGDLWSGNLLPGPGGRPYLIDPSVAYSNPDQDLAMLALFGSSLSAAAAEQIADFGQKLIAQFAELHDRFGDSVRACSQ